MHWVWNFKVHQTCTRTKTSNSFELQNVCVFVPVQVSCKVKFKTHASLDLYCDITSIVCRLLCLYSIVYFACSVLKSQVHFLQRVYKLDINLIPFRARFWFQGTCSCVPFEILFKVKGIQDPCLTGMCNVCEHVIILIPLLSYSYLVS